MAKVYIRLEDKIDETGEEVIDIIVDSDPPFDMEDEDNNTNAQLLAMDTTKAIFNYLGTDDVEISLPKMKFEHEGDDN